MVFTHRRKTAQICLRVLKCFSEPVNHLKTYFFYVFMVLVLLEVHNKHITSNEQRREFKLGAAFKKTKKVFNELEKTAVKKYYFPSLINNLLNSVL